MKSQALSLTLFLLLPISLWGQKLIQGKPWPVVLQGKPLELPWAGGLNRPMPSNIDLNKDGLIDIIIFDRQDESLIPFLQLENGKYVYAPQYVSHFPANDIQDWMLLKDFSCDGLPDLFSGGRQSIQVYRQTQDTANRFALYANPLLATNNVKNPPEVLSILSGFTDLPAFVDIDGDGDLDLLTNGNNGANVYGHRNMAREKYTRCDTLALEVTSRCWGHFEESWDEANNRFDILLGAEPCGHDFKTTHVGGTLTALHLNGDSLIDLIFGDTDADYLIGLYNGGSRQIASMTRKDNPFPANTRPIELAQLPAAYLVDTDADGLSDLLAAPYAWDEGQDVRCLWRYKNEGTETEPVFIYQQNDFLQGEMIDGGTEATPAFGDYNSDGLPDLLVSFGSQYNELGQQNGSLQLFRNTGTLSEPKFESVSLTWNDPLSLFSPFGFTLATPCFADLDGDKRNDVLIGTKSGEVSWWRNTSNGEFTLQTLDLIQLPKDTERSAAPTAFDFDGDGDFDLVVGVARGRILFYENVGNRWQPHYILRTERFGQIEVSDPFWGPISHPQPVFLTLSGKQNPILAVSTQSGSCFLFEVCSDFQGAFPLISEMNPDESGSWARIAPYPNAKNNASDTLGIVWGTWRGGLQRYDLLVSELAQQPGSCEWAPRGSLSFSCQASPNPTSGRFSLFTDAGSDVDIFNVQGQRVYSQTDVQELPIFEVADWAPGVYYCRCSKGKETKTAPLVLMP